MKLGIGRYRTFAALLGIAEILVLFATFPAYSVSFKSCLVSALSRLHSIKKRSLYQIAASRLKRKLHREPRLEVQFVSQPSQAGYPESVTAYESGQKLGDLTFAVNRDIMTIGMMYIEPDFQRIGMSGALLEAALEKYPQIRLIKVEQLSHDNAEVFERQVGRSKRREEAIRATAAYKIRKSLGFGKIVPGSVNMHGGFSVVRSN
jgi:GNAT superfamily N-acetyltransferase